MLRAIIVDDEAPARSELSFLLGETGKVEVVAEAANVREALEKLKDVGAARAARIGVFVFWQASKRLAEVFLMQPFHDVAAG